MLGAAAHPSPKTNAFLAAQPLAATPGKACPEA